MTDHEFLAILLNKDWTISKLNTVNNSEYNKFRTDKEKELIKKKSAYYPGGEVAIKIVPRVTAIPEYWVPDRTGIHIPQAIRLGFELDLKNAQDPNANNFPPHFRNVLFTIRNGVAHTAPIQVKAAPNQPLWVVDYMRLSQAPKTGEWAMVHELHWSEEAADGALAGTGFADVQMWYCC